MDPHQTSGVRVTSDVIGHMEAVMNGPFSQRESCCSVRMDGRRPMLLKMVKSLPIRSVATPAYSSSPRRHIEMETRLKRHFGTRVIGKKITSLCPSKSG